MDVLPCTPGLRRYLSSSSAWSLSSASSMMPRASSNKSLPGASTQPNSALATCPAISSWTSVAALLSPDAVPHHLLLSSQVVDWGVLHVPAYLGSLVLPYRLQMGRLYLRTAQK